MQNLHSFWNRHIKEYFIEEEKTLLCKPPTAQRYTCFKHTNDLFITMV
jgi:hypothetical protein